MKVILKGRHMALTPALRAHAEAKLSAAVARVFDRPAARIEIDLCDLGHTQNGADKECRISVFMPRGPTLIICETDDNMYKAIDLAHDRLIVQLVRARGKKNCVTRVRKMAVRRRDNVASQTLSAGTEPWELEVQEYEQATAHA